MRSEEKNYQIGFNLESNMVCPVHNNLTEKITRIKGKKDSASEPCSFTCSRENVKQNLIPC